MSLPRYFHFFGKFIFQVTVNNTNDGRTSKHSEYDYAKKWQTFQWKCQIAADNTKKCQARNLSSNTRYWAPMIILNLFSKRLENSSSLVRFSNFSEDFRQINCGVPYRIDRPTMVKWNSRHMTSVAEETGHYLLRSDFFTNNFRWIWLVFEDPYGGLLFSFGLIRIDAWFDTCDELINVFCRTAIVFFPHFYAPIDNSHF